MEFLATARKLEIYTIQKCVNFPKRYTFYVSQPLAAAATRIYEDVKRGNSIYPLNQHEVQIRRDYFLHANAELQSMISQLEVAQELFGIEMDTLKYWMDIVDTESWRSYAARFNAWHTVQNMGALYTNLFINSKEDCYGLLQNPVC